MSKARPTQSQMKILLELMAKDPQLCSGKFTQTFTQKIAKKKWEDISIHLNSLPGAQKSWDKWKKVSYVVLYRYLTILLVVEPNLPNLTGLLSLQTWQDTRTNAKSKAAALKRHIAGTGGGPSCSIELTVTEKDTLSLMSQTAVSGHIESTESAVEFDFDEAVEFDFDEAHATEIVTVGKFLKYLSIY